MGDPEEGGVLERVVVPPTPEEQIDFLVNLQRLLDEGQFTASYKYALLLALADLSIENGDDSGAPLTMDTNDIAEKFIQYYWRQTLPYTSPVNAKVLQQNISARTSLDVRPLRTPMVRASSKCASPTISSTDDASTICARVRFSASLTACSRRIKSATVASRRSERSTP
jgi:hypothetical protein